MSAVEKLPDVIWLQTQDDDVTWCEDQVNEDDVEYVRKDSLTPAVIAEVFAETLDEEERDVLKEAIEDSDEGRRIVLMTSPFRLLQLRRLLPKETGDE